MPLAIRERSQFGSPSSVNQFNLILRVCQLIISALVISIYIPRTIDPWYESLHGNLLLGEACGAISFLTAATFAVVPLLISYYYVAILCWWDLLLVCIWAPVVASQMKAFGSQERVNHYKQQGFYAVDTMVTAQWLALTTLLMFLVSALMGAACLWSDRRALASAPLRRTAA